MPNLEPIDEKILSEYPIPLALKYQRVLMEEDSFAKAKALTGAFEALLKYCLCIAIQDSYRIRLVTPQFSAINLEQLLNLRANSIFKLLIDTLFLFNRSQETIFEPELYLLFYSEFSSNTELRTDTDGLIKALLEFAKEYPYRGETKANEFEAEADFQSYLPLLKGLYGQAIFLANLPLLYFHDPVDEIEAIAQTSTTSLATAEVLMGAYAISQAMANRRFPGGPFGRIALKSRRSNTLLSLHPLVMLVETIELLSVTSDDSLSIGPHVVIFYDEIRGIDQEKLLKYWYSEASKQSQTSEAPKLTLTSQGGIFNKFTEWIKTNRTANKTRVQLAQQVSKYIEQRNFNAAITEFEKIAEAEPDNLAIAARLAELYLPANKRLEASYNFGKIAERCLELGLIPQAMLMYQRVHKLNPKDITSSLKLANICSEQGCKEIALQQCERIVENASQINDNEGVLKALELAVSLSPNDANNQRRLASIYLTKKQKPQALKCLLAAAETLYSEHEYKLAAEVYEEVLKVKPLHQTAFTMLGYIYLELGENEKAIEMLVPSCQSEPTNVDLLRALTHAYLNVNELENAYKTFSSLFELDKNLASEFLELGRRFLYAGNLDYVGLIVDKCLQILVSEQKPQQIASLLESCLNQDPHHLPTIKRLVDFYVLINDEANLKRLLQFLATEARSQGLLEDAKTALKQLTSLDPKNRSYLIQLQDLDRYQL